MIKKLQGNFKESSKSIGLFLAKVGSGMLFGLTVSLVLKGFTGMANFAFIFVIVAMTGVFVKLSQKWKFSGVLLFNLFCVMTAMLLRMYIMIAPGE